MGPASQSDRHPLAQQLEGEPGLALQLLDDRSPDVSRRIENARATLSADDGPARGEEVEPALAEHGILRPHGDVCPQTLPFRFLRGGDPDAVLQLTVTAVPVRQRRRPIDDVELTRFQRGRPWTASNRFVVDVSRQRFLDLSPLVK